jgi:hypothetical protein
MKTKTILPQIHIALVLGLMLLVVSCTKPQEDIPPVIENDDVVTMTIAELLALYTVSNDIPYQEIPMGTVISGVVTSCDKEKNCYQYLTIQDETGGIMISLRNTELYNKYPVGLSLTVECDGLVIGHKYRNKQIGIEKDGALTAINKSEEENYLFPDGTVGEEPAPLVITSKNQIDDSYYNRLVRIEGCRMQNGGVDVFCPDSVTTYCTRYMLLADSTVMSLRTMSRASFAHEVLPAGRCNLKGILVNSSAGPLLYLRSLDDVE